jgi:hypothetical protein
MKHVRNAVFWDVTPCDFVRTDVSEERISSIIKVTRIGELGPLAISSVPSSLILVILMMEAIRSS